MTLIDSHAHYYDYEDDSWLSAIDSEKCITILNGIDSQTNLNSIELAEKSNRIKVALGFHPTYIQTKEDVKVAITEADNIRKYLKDNKENNVIAIGEIGLDYYHNKEPSVHELQKKVFKEYLKIANEFKLPVIVHARNSAVDVLEILDKADMKSYVVLHCFEASVKNIEEAIKRRYYFTIPASVGRNEMFQRLVELVPTNKMLTESDAPYQGPIKGENAMPGDMRVAIDYIAEKRGLVNTEVENIIFANYMRVF